ncbi:S-layer homology domain-containing protein [Evtepia sp.]
MKLWKKLTSLLLAAAMMVPFAAAAPSEEGSFPDVDGHWAQAEIEQAVASGWVDGYEDDTFRPERAVTRAEFVKMILDATHLTPGCETVEWMVENAKTRWGNYGTKEYEPRLNDMNDHWLTTQGWTEAALYSGMVVPSDYNNGNFQPQKPIARYEIALMVTRALGQVIEAKVEEGLDLSFTDNEEILDWMKGYVHMASKAGVVKGYPDGSFQPNKVSTRAEAVVMVQRMLDEMEQGLNPDIHLVIQYRDKNGTTVVRDQPSLTMQVVDGMVYIPVRKLFELQADMMKEAGSEYAGYWGKFWYALWWPVEQVCCVYNTQGNTPLEFNYQMGTDRYFNDSLLLGAARALYGEVMIPVCDLNHPDSEVQDNWYYDDWHGAWDRESHTLTLSLLYHAPTLV